MVNKEWLEEENYYEFESNGFKCEIIRHDSMGHLCGYTYLPKGHKYHGLEDLEIDVDVHGGITFTAERDGMWKIGFDCAHYQDLVPYSYERYLQAGLHNEEDVYRNVEYVKSELEALTKQLAEVK